MTEQYQQYGPPQGQQYQQPGYQQGPPPQGYYQTGMPQPPQGQQYGPPQGQQNDAPPLATGSIDDFYSQPSSGGGASWKFAQIGDTHTGIVARPIANSDITQQTRPGTNQPLTFNDGRPKFVMKVPMIVQASERHADGRAQWYCQGGARDELARAMAEAGAPAGPPEAGAAITVTFTGTRPAGQGMNPAKVFQVVYRRPEGAGAPAVPEQAVRDVVREQTAPAPQPAAQVPAQAPAPEQPGQPAPPAAGSANGLDADQQALLARLTNNQG